MSEVSDHIVLLRSKKLDGCLQLQSRVASHLALTLRFRTSLLFVKPKSCNTPGQQIDMPQNSLGLIDSDFNRQQKGFTWCNAILLSASSVICDTNQHSFMEDFAENKTCRKFAANATRCPHIWGPGSLRTARVTV